MDTPTERPARPVVLRIFQTPSTDRSVVTLMATHETWQQLDERLASDRAGIRLRSIVIGRVDSGNGVTARLSVPPITADAIMRFARGY